MHLRVCVRALHLNPLAGLLRTSPTGYLGSVAGIEVRCIMRRPPASFGWVWVAAIALRAAGQTEASEETATANSQVKQARP